jgi:hypothetical protein
MAQLGKYCKAYPIDQFRQYSNWTENFANLRSADEETPRTEVDFLYLQETYVVTDGIFLDENVIFDAVTADWKTFCQDVLQFRVPD